MQKIQFFAITAGKVWGPTPPLIVPTTQQNSIYSSQPPPKILGQKAQSIYKALKATKSQTLKISTAWCYKHIHLFTIYRYWIHVSVATTTGTQLRTVLSIQTNLVLKRKVSIWVSNLLTSTLTSLLARLESGYLHRGIGGCTTGKRILADIFSLLDCQIF